MTNYTRSLSRAAEISRQKSSDHKNVLWDTKALQEFLYPVFLAFLGLILYNTTDRSKRRRQRFGRHIRQRGHSMKKNSESEYIKSIRPTAKALVEELCAHFEYASLLALDSRGKNYRVQRSGVTVSDEPLYCSRGFVIRYTKNKKLYEYSFSSLTKEEIPGIVAHAKELCDDGTYSEKDGYENRADFVLREEPCVASYATEYELDPEEYGDSRIIEDLSAARDAALDSDERVFDAVTRCSYKKYTKLFLSKEKDLCESVMWTTATVITLCKSGDRIKDSYQGFSNLGGAEIIRKMAEEGVALSVKHATELLSSEQITPGEYECICAPDVTGMIVHEAFGHGVEMDMFVKDRALARDYIGKRVASDLVTMHDSACAVKEAASFFFDDEGNVSRDTLIISKGILLGGIADAVSADTLGVAPTGNGRRESYERKAYTRMTNTYFEAGSDSVEDMIASVKHGFLLEEARSGMEDPKNWGIQCMVGIAREIRGGVLTGRIFSPVVLTGYVPDLLKSISMTSKETHLCGTGFCGKGYKEWVKVSDGGPFIKARITLG